MALTTCQECGKQVSELAAVCPHCGAPVQKRSEFEAVSPVPASEGLGTAAFVLSLIGLVLFLVPVLGVLLSVLAIIFACRQAKIKKTGLATAGKVIGIIGIIPSLSALVLCSGMGLGALALPKFNDVSDSAKMNACRANMRTIGAQQVIHYSEHRRYASSLDDLNLEGIRCPSGGTLYLNGDADGYTVRCSTPGHGEIVNGSASWASR